jgi:AcrR family transcriptional regulator
MGQMVLEGNGPSRARITSPRKRGRQRSREFDVRILEAAISELCERGVVGLTFDRLAIEAGVAKTTIYRRWANKFDLIIDAIDLLRSRSPVPDTGNLRADLETGLDNMISTFMSSQGRAIRAVYLQCPYNEELNKAWQEKIAAPHKAAFKAVFDRGVALGQIRLKTEIDEAIALIAGVAFFALLGEVPVRPGLARGVVATLLDGMST